MANPGAKQIEEMLRGLSARQKILLGATAVVALGMIWLFTTLMAKPQFQVLYSGLSPNDEQTLAQRLGSEGVPFQVSTDGASLSVPADKVDRVRMQMAAQGLPRAGDAGWEIFDKPNWMGSDFDDQVDYQRALEGELERSILTLDDIEAVRVHVVMPHDSLFLDQSEPAKASVIVRPRDGGVSDRDVIAIRRLVAGAVENLKPENVTVVDANGDVPLLPGQNGLPAQVGDGSLGSQLAQKLVAILTPVVGAGKVHAKVDVQYDPSSREVSDQTYNPQGAVLATTQQSFDGVNAPALAGIPGAASNVPGPQPGAPGKKDANGKTLAAGAVSATATPAGGQGETRRSESSSYYVSSQVTHEVDPAGRVLRVTAAVVVDDATVQQKQGKKTTTLEQARSPQQMQQITDLAKAAIGFNPQRGDQLVVENMPFAATATTAPPPPALTQRVKQVSDEFGTELHYAGLLLLFLLAYALILRPLQKQIAAAMKRSPQPAALPAASPRAMAAAEEAALPTPTAPPQARRAEQIKQQLVESVRKQPEASSQLVRNWLRAGVEE